MDALAASIWSARDLPRALAVAAAERPGSVAPRQDWGALGSPESENGADVDAWIRQAAALLDLEAVAVDASAAELPSALKRAAPAVVAIPPGRLPGAGAGFLLLLKRSRGGALTVQGPDLAERAVSAQRVCELLSASDSQESCAQLDSLVQLLAGGDDTARLRASLQREQQRSLRVSLGWLLRLREQGSVGASARDAGVVRMAIAYVAMHLMATAAWITAWLLVGEDLLEGRLDPGWLAGAGLGLLAFGVMRVLADRCQTQLALRVGLLLRARLFEGALALNPQSVRTDGAGQFLGRLFEAQVVEALAVGGGLAIVTAGLELAVALGILAFAAQSSALAFMLVAAIVALAALAVDHLRKRRAWALERRELTHHLIEQMVGHRTRLMQQSPRAWHGSDDALLSAYFAKSCPLDSTTVTMSALPRAWMLAGTLVLLVGLVGSIEQARLAAALACTLLAYQALRRLAMGVPSLCGAIVAWDEANGLLAAQQVSPKDGASATPPGKVGASAHRSTLEAQALVVRPAPARSAVLDGGVFCIRPGDKILLEGPSGAGKSTLAAVLAGLRKPDQGVLLMRGLDLDSLGHDAWRKRAALAAQFHDNHVISETLAFNLLMGRRWPPEPEDLQIALTVCRELGLGSLIERMPAGLFQAVGENGWQLSHGERSRLFIARALLQDPDLVILDESTAALDAETLLASVSCALRRARSLVLVAHT